MPSSLQVSVFVLDVTRISSQAIVAAKADKTFHLFRAIAVVI